MNHFSGAGYPRVLFEIWQAKMQTFNFHFRACQLTGVGRNKMTEIRDQLLENKFPQAAEDTRGRFTRVATHRDLLPKVQLNILTYGKTFKKMRNYMICLNICLFYLFEVFSLLKLPHDLVLNTVRDASRHVVKSFIKPIYLCFHPYW